MKQKIALIGQPNSGKTSVFNFLTGLYQKISNYAGVTVDLHEGRFRFSKEITIVDSPGLDYLNKKSIDAGIATEMIEKAEDIDYFALVIDSTKLEEGAFLIEQIYAAGKPFFIIMNMLDELYIRGGNIDTEYLSKIYECPVLSCSAKKGIGMHKIVQLIRSLDPQTLKRRKPLALSESEMREKAKKNAERAVLKKISSHKLTDKLDALFLHRYRGIFFLILFSYVIFESIFSWVSPVQDWILAELSKLSAFTGQFIHNETLLSLVNDGVIASVGSVLVFLPQIAILSFFIGLMEFSGYMTRAAMLLDRFFEFLGIEGKAFFPLFISNACAVPAIMATRIMSHTKSRFITALITPFGVCSARLPVYFIIITAFIPNTVYYGFISLRTLVYLGLYFASLFIIVVTVKILAFLIKDEEPQTVKQIMDLPTYRIPSLKMIGTHIWKNILMFLNRVGTIIFPFSLLIWVLSYFPHGNIDSSFIAYLGEFIQPIFAPLGFDWKISVAILCSLTAREVVISTLALLYKIPEVDTEVIKTFTEQMSLAQALSILVFFIFSLQCMATIATLKRELKRWKYPFFLFVYMFSLAYAASAITYRAFS